MNIVILTGAGISAESGIGTFRDAGGLWEQYPIEQVATPEGFAADPDLVHRFYNSRRANAAKAEPNAAHKALAKLEAHHSGDVFIVTQNVDDLHERGGSQNILHMHGALNRATCTTCEHRWPAAAEMHPDDPCPKCTAPTTRPDIVWFGEIPQGMNTIEAKLYAADLFVSIGTSGTVYPAAGFVQTAKALGIATLELNMETSSGIFDESRNGPATELVPAWVAETLA
jgi:NAD-dependent deacetylase